MYLKFVSLFLFPSLRHLPVLFLLFMVSRCPYLQHLALLSFKFLRQHVSHLNLHHLASFYFTFYVSVSPLLFLSFIVFLSLLVSILTLSSSLLFQVFLSICPFLHRSALFYFQVFTSMCPSLHHLLLSRSLSIFTFSFSILFHVSLCPFCTICLYLI